MEKYLKSRLLHLRAMIRAMARTLTPKPDHMMLFYDYSHKVKPGLLKIDTDRKNSLHE